ncbi:uncharacterized protein RCO7_10213 [Rhynchosporium graminicola]|uniref:Heterokaryon incompatibility domain-containing protein n=1 Tax=Rhynchosporium graminicola TaxID=2792576 RepID=A0A1E1K3S3_9HELO|nr:uncharacterized protein RCO7_10213 [Rhynchosporium commune]
MDAIAETEINDAFDEHTNTPDLQNSDPSKQAAEEENSKSDADSSSDSSDSAFVFDERAVDEDSDADSDVDARELIKSLVEEVGEDIFSQVSEIDSSICAPCVNIVCAFSDQAELNPIRTKVKASAATLLHHRSMKALLECSSTCKMCLLILHLLSVNGSDVMILAQKLSDNEEVLVKLLERDKEEFEKTVVKPERYNWRRRVWRLMVASTKAWFEKEHGQTGVVWYEGAKGPAGVHLSGARVEILLTWARSMKVDGKNVDVDALSSSSSSSSSKSGNGSLDPSVDAHEPEKESMSASKTASNSPEATQTFDMLEDTSDAPPKPNYLAAITDSIESAHMLELLATARSLEKRYRLHSREYQLREVRGYKGQIVELQVVYGTERYPARVFSTKGDNISAEKYLGRPVYRNAKSPETLALMSKWFKNCFQNHAECRWSSNASELDPILPSRVVDIGPATSEDFVPRLLSPGSQRGKWAALSHRWGHANILRTLSNNVQEIEAGIDISKLPATFRDAIFLTRHLGLRYLWIDSLCIIQDSPSDWLKEAASMPNIYRNSFITIAAAATENSTGGIFVDRSWLPTSKPCTIPVQIRSGSEHGTLHFDVPFDTNIQGNETNYLRSRAWCIQESLLSHRLLMFVTLQMSYTCVRQGLVESRQTPFTISCEERNKILEKFQHRSSNDLRTHQDELLPSTLRSMIITWYDILYDYTRRDLTFSNDRLIAISGIVAVVGSSIEDDYVAGLWRRDMPRALLWSPFEEETLPNAPHVSRGPPLYRAPSWSWASVDSPISCFLCRERMPDPPIATVLEVNTTLVGSDMYGQVSAGFLMIKAPLRRAVVGETSQVWPQQPLLKLDGWEEGDITHAIFDLTVHDMEEGSKCWCLLITDVYGLILVEREERVESIAENWGGGKESVFERIGIFHSRNTEVVRSVWFENTDFRTVIIV